jgi:ubiquinone/menaquinone biosynthesis C-methylase UbiE
MSQDPYYASRYVFDPKRKIVWKEIVKFLQKFVSTNGTVLDLGAGYCDFINNISAGEKYAVDISPELEKYAGKNIKKINSPAWNLSAILDESVDVVFASNLLEHLAEEELQKTASEIKRVLKPTGKLILMQPNYRLSAKKYFDDPTHKKIFDDISLENFLISRDFRIIKKMPRFLPFSMRSNSSLIPNFLLPFVVRIYIRSPIKPLASQMLFVAEKPGF